MAKNGKCLGSLGHPLLSASLSKRVANSGLDEAALDRLLDRMVEILNGYDRCLAAAAERVDEENRRTRALMDGQFKRLRSEYNALIAMVRADYDKLLNPVADYHAKVAEERNAVLRDLEAAWNAEVDKRNQVSREMAADIDRELKRFGAEAFRRGKDALNQAPADARAEARVEG
jgi:hypothetical protein